MTATLEETVDQFAIAVQQEVNATHLARGPTLQTPEQLFQRNPASAIPATVTYKAVYGRDGKCCLIMEKLERAHRTEPTDLTRVPHRCGASTVRVDKVYRKYFAVVLRLSNCGLHLHI